MPKQISVVLDKLKVFFSNRTNALLVGALVLIILGAFFAFSRLSSNTPTLNAILNEVTLDFDPEGPYALLLPRKDGNALVLNIKRVSAYDRISYEMTYQSDGIDRGVQGTIDIKDKKSEYSQEILFGTCSTVDTFNIAHCAFDKNVENGTLILKIQEGTTLYIMNTAWHFEKPDVELGKVDSADGHFTYTTNSSTQDLVNVGFTIINDLTGLPKLPEGKQVVGKVYALNVPVAKTFPAGDLKIELAEEPGEGVQIGRYNEGKNEWELLETSVDGSSVAATSPEGGIFAVLVDQSPK